MDYLPGQYISNSNKSITPHFRLDNIRYTGGSWVNEEVLVRVCDDGGDRYRFGFNGQEKVNEIAGMGTHLDFGARIYDSRVGRFLSLDPLMNKFPSESNYIFAGNNPIFFIDENGEKKTIYSYTIDMRNNTITIPTKGTVVDGLYAIHKWDYNGLDYYSWHDYSVNQVTVIDQNGKQRTYESSPFNIDYRNQKARSVFPSETIARAIARESWFDFTMPEKEGKPGKIYGGLRLASRKGGIGVGRDNKLNKTGDGKTVYVDELIAMLTIAGSANFVKSSKSFVDAVKYMVDGAGVASAMQEIAPIDSKNLKDITPVDTVCFFCKGPSHGLDMNVINKDGKVIKTIKKEDYGKINK